MAELLAPDPGLTALLQMVSTAATTNAIPDGYRIDECNSFYNHGSPGVSNAFGSALWVVDYLFANAAKGSAGVNFHGGGAGQDGTTPFYYTPIEETAGAVTGAQPIFYGMLLFTLAGTGNLLATTAKAGSLAFSAYSVAQADGSTNVVLVNEDATSSVQATVDVGTNVVSASAIYLQAASLTSQTGITLGGTAISPAGEWTPNAPWTLPVAAHTVMVNIPPATAVVVHAH